MKKRTAKDRSEKKRARIGSWNLHWFPDGASRNPGRAGGTDVDWMACVVAWMDLQALAVQEVVQHLRGRRALLDLLDRLDEFTGGSWEAKLDDCPDDGRQHVGLLFDTMRVKATALRTVGSLNPTGSRCGHRLRPGYAAYLRFNGGADLHLINLHLDSGVSARDYHNRAASWTRLKAVIQDQHPVGLDDDVVVLGDFNTMGCSKCAPRISARDEIVALERILARTPATMRRMKASRDCTAHYRGRGTTLDHVFVSSRMKEVPADAAAKVEGVCADSSCFRQKSAAKAALSRLSDHCPIILELVDQDLD
ncbi:MAG: endonuclease/exonuclease/phosphatase family protein [Deltaproteobacteria bacterium]|nr:endonuclease/exonuclease/phosphatase family protein [Deltaproteobacteria bacterium]